LSELKLREDARAEQLSVADFLSLYRVIASKPLEGGPGNRS
jgi:16S rRNA A1518/A1519 N6-dimethyltransferase RsmA/KsgA/DIM1 with predicted DNA glycosylase/AP lyase activity